MALTVGLVATVTACPSGGRPPRAEPQPPEAAIPRAERPFVVDPLEGYPLVPAPDAAAEAQGAWAALSRTGDLGAARRAAASLLEKDPGFHPARVLAAQVDFLEGAEEEALEALDPLAQELPSYVAAQLLRGRAAERLDRVPEAYAAYREIAELSPAAHDRAEVLRERAVEIVAHRLQSDLDRGRLDDAAEQLAHLERWAPDAEQTLESTRSVAAARGDRRSELAAVEGLLQRHPDRRELRVRRAELELEVGDPSRGLQLFQDLADEYPRDRELQDQLAQAKFRWRLTLLPAPVQEISRKAELTRADFASLIHWLVPRVRTSRAPAGRIAGDILEHPRREEIARVVNLGLMEVDPTLHTFSPDQPVTRERALAALLRAVESLGGPAACLDGPVGERPPTERVCEVAAHCGLIAEPADCLPGGTLSGAEALELVRRALELF